MDEKWFEIFSDREYWENAVQTYIKTGRVPGKSPYLQTGDLWDYFKFCILTDNRFFFDHPISEIIKSKIKEHEITLPAKTTFFRARIDSDGSLKDKAEALLKVEMFKRLKEKRQVQNEEKINEFIECCHSVNGYDEYQEQYKNGFEGFSASESMSPPAFKVSNGRCNLPNSPHLYAAADIHTAIVETRPYIHDTISVVSFSCKKDLKIIDFCFDCDDQERLPDWFYIAISSDFSAVNKGNENDYFATQYVTMLVKSLGYDGLKFKSSLVFDGTNYVIFDDSVCCPISSKLYTVAQTHYDVLSFPDNSHFLKDANGNNVPNPPISRC